MKHAKAKSSAPPASETPVTTRRVRASAPYQRASAVYNELHGGSSLRRIGHALKLIDVAEVHVCIRTMRVGASEALKAELADLRTAKYVFTKIAERKRREAARAQKDGAS